MAAWGDGYGAPFTRSRSVADAGPGSGRKVLRSPVRAMFSVGRLLMENVKRVMLGDLWYS